LGTHAGSNLLPLPNPAATRGAQGHRGTFVIVILYAIKNAHPHFLVSFFVFPLFFLQTEREQAFDVQYQKEGIGMSPTVISE
jgi:hypothetical protein